MSARNSNGARGTLNTENAPTKEKGYIGRDSETTDKRANLAAASAQAAAKKRNGKGENAATGASAGKDGKGAKGAKGGKRKPTEEELTEFARDLDRSMVEKAQTNFRKGLIASVIVVVIVVVLIIAAKYFLGIGAEG